MPWLKVGDTAAEHPLFHATLAQEGADDRTLNEVRGFILTLALGSASHMTDYEVTAGSVIAAAGSLTRAKWLLAACTSAGLLAPVEGRSDVFALVEDPDFMHIRSKREIEWERQRRNDTSSKALKCAVLLRDGDNCRWCGTLVYWTGRMSARKATLDHLLAGQAGTPETMVVSCASCNGMRGDDTSGQWEHAHELLPPPRTPHYSDWTRQYLESNGFLDETGKPRVKVASCISPGEIAPGGRARSGSGDVEEGVGLPERVEAPDGDPGTPVPTAPAVLLGGGESTPSLGDASPIGDPGAHAPTAPLSVAHATATTGEPGTPVPTGPAVLSGGGESTPSLGDVSPTIPDDEPDAPTHAGASSPVSSPGRVRESRPLESVLPGSGREWTGGEGKVRGGSGRAGKAGGRRRRRRRSR